MGSLGRHLVTGMNNPDMPLAITIGGQQLNGLTPAPHFSGQFWMSWAGGSSYNSLQATVQKRYSNGLSLLGTYTWAHAFDNTTDLLGGDYGAYKQSALIPIKYEWGQSGYDIRNRAVINVDYDLPFGVGRPMLNHRAAGQNRWRMEDRHGMVGPDRPAVHGRHQQTLGLAERQWWPEQQRR